MNITLRPQRLIAQWIPGLAFVYVLLLTLPGSFQTLFTPMGYTAANGQQFTFQFTTVEELLVFLVLGLVAGELLDSFRDLLEHLWDRWSRVNWSFLVRKDGDELSKFVERHFTHYVFNCNLVIPSLILLLFGPFTLRLVGLVAAAVFIFDAVSLRRGIVRFTNSGKDA
jgi:hypothetical protein